MAALNRNIALLFTTRLTRLFAYGFLSIVLVLYLAQTGLSEAQIGLLLTLTLIGDAVVTLWITTSADRIGRRRMLIFGALLMVLAGIIFVLTRNYALLIIAAIIGVISPSGNEIGPFLAIEQAALTQLISNERRTQVFAWYNLVGSFATAFGALCGGWVTQVLQVNGFSEFRSYQALIIGYAVIGGVLSLLFMLLSPAVEVRTAPETSEPRFFSGWNFGLGRSRKIIFKLSAMFALDAFAGGFVIQSMIVYWFHVRFGMNAAVLGTIFFWANVLAGVSALLAVRIAAKIGLIKTMVFTHIPSNVLLCLVPLMPFPWLAIAVLLLRFSISQMDVPTRQSFTVAVVEPEERSAASGVTAIARSIGASVSPVLAGLLMAVNWLMSAPFMIAGGLKIIYDLILYRSFKTIKPPEEKE